MKNFNPHDLPPSAIRAMAETLRAEAASLDSIADQAERYHADKLNSIKRRRGRDLAARMVTDLLHEGLRPDEAARRACAHYRAQGYDIGIEEIQVIWDRQNRQRLEFDRLNEERECLALYRSGHTKKEIADRMGKHPATIGRMIDRVLSDTDVLRDLHETVKRIKGRGMLHEVKLRSGRRAAS